MTHPQYGKPETWPRVPKPRRIVHYDVEFGRMFWYVVQRTWDLPGRIPVVHLVEATVAGPYWRVESALKRAEQLLREAEVFE